MMHLSERAKQLLNAGNIEALQALSYEVLLPSAVRDEILSSFYNPRVSVRPNDSVAEVFLDPTHYETLEVACTLSSGQILSERAIRDYLRTARPRDGIITCPITREPLMLNIGGSGLAYVHLPKIDAIIQGFKRLHLQPPVSKDLGKSFDPTREGVAVKNQHHSAMPALQYLDRKSGIRATPSAPPASPEVVGTFGLKVTHNKLRINIVVASTEDRNALEQHLDRALPQESKIVHNPGFRSYSMSSESFGRCWKTLGEYAIELDLWFPPHAPESSRRTLNDRHLAYMLSELSRVFNLPPVTMPAEMGESCSIADMQPKVYVGAMDDTPGTLNQLISACQRFLDISQEIAERLRMPILDTVIRLERSAPQARTGGFGIFGSMNEATTSSSSQGHSCRK